MKDSKPQNAKTSTEMSLDEVLSSIKEMVVGEEPPVLELTNIVVDDESNTENRSLDLSEKVEAQSSSGDMKTFLQMAQNNAIRNEKVSSSSIDKNSTQEQQVLSAVLQRIIAPIVDNWIKENLPQIAGEIVEREVKKILKS